MRTPVYIQQRTCCFLRGHHDDDEGAETTKSLRKRSYFLTCQNHVNLAPFYLLRFVLVVLSKSDRILACFGVRPCCLLRATALWDSSRPFSLPSLPFCLNVVSRRFAISDPRLQHLPISARPRFLAQCYRPILILHIALIPFMKYTIQVRYYLLPISSITHSRSLSLSVSLLTLLLTLPRLILFSSSFFFPLLPHSPAYEASFGPYTYPLSRLFSSLHSTSSNYQSQPTFR